MAFISSFNLYSKEEIGANRWPITLPILYISKIKKIFPSYEGPNCVLILTVFSIAVRNNGSIVLVLACLEFELTTSTNKIVNYANDMANSKE